MNVPDEGY